MDPELAQLSFETGEFLRARNLMLCTVESCTGGWIGELVTATAGSSNWYDRGFVTYSNDAKVELLGVDPALLRAHGAVSEEKWGGLYAKPAEPGCLASVGCH